MVPNHRCQLKLAVLERCQTPNIRSASDKLFFRLRWGPEAQSVSFELHLILVQVAMSKQRRREEVWEAFLLDLVTNVVTGFSFVIICSICSVMYQFYHFGILPPLLVSHILNNCYIYMSRSWICVPGSNQLAPCSVPCGFITPSYTCGSRLIFYPPVSYLPPCKSC